MLTPVLLDLAAQMLYASMDEGVRLGRSLNWRWWLGGITLMVVALLSWRLGRSSQSAPLPTASTSSMWIRWRDAADRLLTHRRQTSRLAPILTPSPAHLSPLFSEEERRLLELMLDQMAKARRYSPTFLLDVAGRLVPGLTNRDTALRHSSLVFAQDDYVRSSGKIAIVAALLLSWGLLLFGGVYPDGWVAAGGFIALSMALFFVGRLDTLDSALFVRQFLDGGAHLRVPLMGVGAQAALAYRTAVEAEIQRAHDAVWEEQRPAAPDVVFHSLFTRQQRQILAQLFDDLEEKGLGGFLERERLKRRLRLKASAPDTLLRVSDAGYQLEDEVASLGERIWQQAEQQEPGVAGQAESDVHHAVSRHRFLVWGFVVSGIAGAVFGWLSFSAVLAALSLVYVADWLYASLRWRRVASVLTRVLGEEDGVTVALRNLPGDAFHRHAEEVLRRTMEEGQRARLSGDRAGLSRWRRAYDCLAPVGILYLTSNWALVEAGAVRVANWLGYTAMLLMVVALLWAVIGTNRDRQHRRGGWSSGRTGAAIALFVLVGGASALGVGLEGAVAHAPDALWMLVSTGLSAAVQYGWLAVFLLPML